MKDKLIEKLKSGDERSFEEVMWKYAGYVYAVVRNHSAGLLTQEDMEELVSDAFASLWQTRADLDAGRPLMPYLAVIARNKTISRLRTVRLTVGLEEAAEIAAEEDLSEWEKAAAEDILEAAGKLSGTSREIFIRHYLYGEPLERIAEELKISPSNVRTKLCRARERIRKILTERGYFNERKIIAL